MRLKRNCPGCSVPAKSCREREEPSVEVAPRTLLDPINRVDSKAPKEHAFSVIKGYLRGTADVPFVFKDALHSKK
jgi:hypothetical protein